VLNSDLRKRSENLWLLLSLKSKLRTIMNLTFKTIILTILILVSFESTAQKKETDVEYDNALLITPTYSLLIPAAETGHRFGLTHSFGMAFDYKFGKNWMVGLEGNFLFGRNIKEKGIIRNVLAANSMAITTPGELDNIDLSMRGTVNRFHFGKIFRFSDSKPNNGLLLKFGAGYMMHKIIIDAKKDVVPQLSGDYAKGYDRMTHGLVLSQFIGLIKLERSKLINLYAGIELMQGITKNARNWDFYQGRKLDGTRFEFMIGLKMGWMIPVFFGETTGSEFYYY
jgi:hypothetical protein